MLSILGFIEPYDQNSQRQVGKEGGDRKESRTLLHLVPVGSAVMERESAQRVLQAEGRVGQRAPRATGPIRTLLQGTASPRALGKVLLALVLQ